MKRIDLYNRLNQILHGMGFDIRRFPGIGHRGLLKYLKDNEVVTCFDVGANIGQYASSLRASGFQGEIFSFEPQAKAFAQLSKTASREGKWKAYNIAFGETNEKSAINISKNSVSSSILEITDFLVDTLPETEFIALEDIQMKRLDTFVREIDFNKNFFLKVDAQGFESKILNGASNCMQSIYALQLELSCTALYKGERLFDEMKMLIESKGFYLSSLENGFIDPQNGRLLQVEAVFLREI